MGGMVKMGCESCNAEVSLIQSFLLMTGWERGIERPPESGYWMGKIVPLWHSYFPYKKNQFDFNPNKK